MKFSMVQLVLVVVSLGLAVFSLVLLLLPFFGVLDLVFALGAGAGAASNTISCLGADFGLDADLGLGAGSKIVSSLAFFLGAAVETEAARFGAASSSIFTGSS